MRATIKNILATAIILGTDELRRAMPAGTRADEFDATLLAMHDDGEVTLSQDKDPVALNETQCGEMVWDGPVVFTTVMLRG